MEDRKNELTVEDKVAEGVGFVVGSHNYGGLNRMSFEDLASLSLHLAELAGQVEELQRGIRYAQGLCLDRRAEEFRNKLDK